MITDFEALPNGPWSAVRYSAGWAVKSADGKHIVGAPYIGDESVARAIAAIPSMLEEIERLREECEIQRKGAGAFAESYITAGRQRDGFRTERDRLRARITELEENRCAACRASDRTAQQADEARGG